MHRHSFSNDEVAQMKKDLLLATSVVLHEALPQGTRSKAKGFAELLRPGDVVITFWDLLVEVVEEALYDLKRNGNTICVMAPSAS